MAVKDWEETACTPWGTKGVTAQGDMATITRARTHTWERVVGKWEPTGDMGEDNKPIMEIVEYPETELREETSMVKHYRTEFDGNLQTVTAWHKNIKREIVADLGDLNRVEATEQDITAKVA